jgi:hypothetical protein
VNVAVDAIVGLARFVYGFLVGDDWTVALGMLVALVATGAMVGAGINAWWLVPLLAAVMTGISLWRRRVAASK